MRAQYSVDRLEYLAHARIRDGPAPALTLKILGADEPTGPWPCHFPRLLGSRNFRFDFLGLSGA
jgi:hypothetical protein